MTDDRPESKPDTDDGRRAPRKAFLMVLPVINADGTVNPEESVTCTTTDLESAIQIAKDRVDEENEEFYVYECRPIRRVSRGAVVVQTVMKPASPTK